MPEARDVECDCKCQAKDPDAERLREGICPYCVRNKKAVSPEEDYFTKIQRDGY